MAKSKPIQIHIPKPCSEHWSKMSATEKGRFCQNCQKEVIDFTSWTDESIYNFLKESVGSHTCGRFCNTQLNRPINIPPQPHSRLYKLFIGMGMTLLFVSALPPNTYAKAPLICISDSPNFGEHEPDSTNSITISGVVVDENKEPIIGAIVFLIKGDSIIGGAQTNIDGLFKINIASDDTGDLHLKCHYAAYETAIVSINNANILNHHTIELVQNEDILTGDIVIIEYKAPLIDKFSPGNNKTITSDELEKGAY